MPRVTRAPARKQRHKKVLKAAKGFFGSRGKLYRVAKDTVLKAGSYAYRDRRVRKREFRALWITRVGAACHQRSISYSAFMAGLIKARCTLNRKMLSEIAIADPQGFDKLVALAQQPVTA